LTIGNDGARAVAVDDGGCGLSADGPARLPAVAFRSIGCRTNQEEMFALRAELSSRGFIVTDELDRADIIAVNTCSVTSLTESKTGRFIKSLVRVNPGARILVTGCFAQQHGEAVLKYPGVAWVVGNGDKHRIPEIISTRKQGSYLSGIDGNSRVFWEDKVLGPAESGRTRFSLKIQEGCGFGCAYCIVPSLRGPSRSAPRALVVEQFRRAVDNGYREIVLTGTHIGQYGGGGRHTGVSQDVNAGGHPGAGLESLLEDLLKIPGDYRIRLSSLDPRDLTDGIMALAGSHPRVCDHLHVSVQSLCPEVLELMGRPHRGVDKLAARLRGFRQKYPAAGLGADLIAGHPGETGAMFGAGLAAVESVGFTYAHIFRYSKRLGTKAAEMAGQVDEPVKKKRSEALRASVEKSRENFLSLLFGVSVIYIIAESEYPVRGVGGNYVRVELPGLRLPKNSRVPVVLTGEVRGGYCVGKECKPNVVLHNGDKESL